MERTTVNNLADMIWIEWRKALRSRIPLFTALGLLMLPLSDAFLMVIFKDPEFARSVGLISAKANLIGGSADWPTFLSVLAQGIAVGGIVVFGLIAAWVFGREFADGTLTDMLAVPVSRPAMLLAKFAVIALWCLALTVFIGGVGLGIGALLVLPGGSPDLFIRGVAAVLITACLVIVVLTPVALLASAGRGYLLPLGILFLVIALTQLIALIGYGEVFPWAIPALYAGLTGDAALEPISYWIVALTGLIGIAATQVWWRYADQSR